MSFQASLKVMLLSVIMIVLSLSKGATKVLLTAPAIPPAMRRSYEAFGGTMDSLYRGSFVNSHTPYGLMAYMINSPRAYNPSQIKLGWVYWCQLNPKRRMSYTLVQDSSTRWKDCAAH